MLTQLPLSWIRGHVPAPQFTVVRLPLSGAAWIPVAEIPFQMAFDSIYDQLAAAQPRGFVLQLCSELLSRFVTQQGGQAVQVGLEAVLPLQSPHQFKPSVAELARRGLRWGSVQEFEPSPETQGALQRLAAASTHGRKPQLAFAYRTRLEPGARCFALVEADGNWLGAMTLSRASQTGLHTELMVRHSAAPVGVMEALTLHIFAGLRVEGWLQWSLGGVPFALAHDLSGAEQILPAGWLPPKKSNLVNQAGRMLKFAYNYRGLLDFKDKFSPQWQPLYLCGSRGISWAILFDLAFKSRYLQLVRRQFQAHVLNI